MKPVTHWNPKKVMDLPLHWHKPRHVELSMSDLFHEDVPHEFIKAVFSVMVACPQHSFQILTKRPERLVELSWSGFAEAVWGGSAHFSDAYLKRDWAWPLSNVWLGVSVENQRYADERIPLLAQCPAAVRFVSCEPLLSAIDLRPYLPCETIGGVEFEHWPNWVIIGGESGPSHRPMKVEWVQSIVLQCKEAGVPCFIKQDSGLRPGEQGRLSDALWNLKEFPNGSGAAPN